ncbi:MAG: DUF2345 domain-containing protein, partial [Azoarcus sp.]|nr:DUF2345 domain-containing protein [Azoarcus sp.]
KILATAGGAYLKIEGGNIELHAPGPVNFQSSMKNWTDPASASGSGVSFPKAGKLVFPDATTSPLKRTMRFSLGALPGVMQNHAGEPYTLYADGAQLLKGQTDEQGSVMWEHKEGTKQYTVELVTGQKWEIDVIDQLETEGQRLANQGYRGYKSEAAQPAENAPGSEDAFRRWVFSGKSGGQS